MPAPLITLLAGVGVSQAQSILGRFANWAWEPMGVAMEQWRRSAYPYWIPDVTAIIAAGARGFLTPARTAIGMGFSGAAPTPDSPYPDFSLHHRLCYDLWAGVSKLTLLQPDPAQLLAAENRGFVDFAADNQLWKSGGGDSANWSKVRDALRAWLTPSELFALRNRGVIPDDRTLRAWLVAYGGYADDALKYLLELRHQILNPSDLIQAAVKDAFDPTIAGPNQLNWEFPELFRKYFAYHGYEREIDYEITVEGGKRKATWADILWASHWRNLAPTTIYDFYHRFRQDPANPGQSVVPGVKAFTEEDAKRWLKTDDFPPSVRDWLLAASHRLLGRIDIRRLHNAKIINDGEAVGFYRDIGYRPEQAQQLVQLITRRDEIEEEERDRKRLPKIKEHYAQEALAGYTVGHLTREEAFDALLAADWDDDAATIALSTADLARERRTVGLAIEATKRGFLQGSMDQGQAEGALRQIGINPNAIATYLLRWRQLLTLRRRVASTSQIMDWLRYGLIQASYAERMLANLGYAQIDQAAILGKVAQNVGRDLAAEELRRARTERERQRALERAVRQAREEHNRLRSELERHGTPAMLKRWVQEGIMTRAEAAGRLAAIDWPAEDIEHLLDEVD